MDFEFRTSADRVLEIGLMATMLSFPNGRSGYLFTFQDVTELRRLERNARLQQRLAAVGEMAAGIAHEIRNPLASMSGSIQVLRQELPLSEEQGQLMDIVLRESERLNDTIRSFLAYARPQKFAVARLDLAKVVHDTVLLIRNSAEVEGHPHGRCTGAPREPVWFEADENQIRQVVWNIASNGLRAMPGGGRLLLSVETDTANERDEVVLGVQDNGRGIPAEEIDSIFQPFRSSFEGGTGLGLAIVHRIVTDYGGVIQVSSTVGVGTIVRVRFPARATPADSSRRRLECRRRSRGDVLFHSQAGVTSMESIAAASAGTKLRILVVDDELSMREMLRIVLRRDGYDVVLAENGREAIALLQAGPFDMLLSDIRMPDMSGVDVLRAAKALDPQIVAFMMTAFASTDTAVEAMRLGALDYFTKPFNMDELRLKIRQHVEARRLKQENLLLKRALKSRHEFASILGRSDAMQVVFSTIETVANTSSTVLVSGESGTGKELVARAIHFNSLRRDRPFVAVNCGAVPETLLESELFGHVRGAFTGAHANKKGLMEVAEGGSIFLDEIGEMPTSMQVKLLRVLQDRRFRRLGGTDEVQADVQGHRRHESGPAEDGVRGTVSRRPLLPAQRALDPGAAAARARRGHPVAGRTLPRAVRCTNGQARSGALRSGLAASAGPSMARQRPGAPERHRACRGAREDGSRSSRKASPMTFDWDGRPRRHRQPNCRRSATVSTSRRGARTSTGTTSPWRWSGPVGCRSRRLNCSA